MATSDYCNVPLSPHEQVDCANYPKGGIPILALMETDHSIVDLTSNAQWLTAIAAGEVVLLKGVKATLEPGAEVTQTNPVGDGPDNITTGFDYQVTYTDANVTVDNDAAYSTYNGRTLFMVLYNPNTGLLTYIDQSALFVAPIATIPATKREYQQYSAVVRWTSDIDWYATKFAAPVAFTG